MNEVEQRSCRSAVTSRAGGKLFSGTISRKVDGRATVAPTPSAFTEPEIDQSLINL